MRSTMQAGPLQLRQLLEQGTTNHGDSTVRTATDSGIDIATYRELGTGITKLANALYTLGIRPGDRVGTFMWNNRQHVEAYFAVPCMGAVLHPLNIRLAPHQVVHTANHAADRVVIVDASLLSSFLPILHQLPTVEHVIVNGAGPNTDAVNGVPVHDYATLLAGQLDYYPWPDTWEDDAAAICYTSGTTGEPKGVVYSHRSIYLHAMGIALPDALSLSSVDRVLAVVPQFHVLAWGLPYAAFLTGADLAMPDRFLQAEPLAEFIATARPTKAAGVPTVWQSLLDHLATRPDLQIGSLREVLVGGNACPPALMKSYQEDHGITLLHAWGMTEASPMGSVARVPGPAGDPAGDPRRRSQGRFSALVESRLVALDGTVLPKDGHTVGEVQIRGPWVTASYYREPDRQKFDRGWLRTGDIGVITPDGWLTITDRVKDVIKSGGEWISSVELENHLMDHPAVPEAAVIAVPDRKWGERPMACVVVRAGYGVSINDLRAFLSYRVPKWQLPERWTALAEIPKTSVGKFDKMRLRERFRKGELEVKFLG